MRFSSLFNYSKLFLFVVIILIVFSLNSCGEGSDNSTLKTDTPVEEPVNGGGGGGNESDRDKDGVADSDDICKNTPAGEIANVLSTGCSPSEITVDSEADETNKFYMSFNAIKVGEFQMGSPENETGRSNGGLETLHPVQLTKKFSLQTTELTQYQWRAVLDAAGNKDLSLSKQPSNNFGCLNCPVENISWFKIGKFIRVLNTLTSGTADSPYRLPTEAEWEYVCRAGSSTPFSNNITDDIDLDGIGWFYDNFDQGGKNKTSIVAQKKPNAWGFYDMHGNVWEFCSDWFIDYDEFADPDDTSIDPTGASDALAYFTQKKSARGGAASFQSSSCRSASRKGILKGDDSSYTGFRLVREEL